MLCAIDAIIIDGPSNVGYEPVSWTQISCEGSETNFNECTYARPPNGDCVQTAISCRKSSSKKPSLKLPHYNCCCLPETDQPRCLEPTRTSFKIPTSSDRYIIMHHTKETLTGNYSSSIFSYGECSVYTSKVDVCEGVVSLGIDHVYARSRLGTQSNIAQMLNENLKSAESIIADQNRNCVKMVYRALCHFYLPPCGNATHPAPPSSICPKECKMVQEECDTTLNTVLLTFDEDVTPVINCNDTSSLLFPVPHCCTGAGLGMTPFTLPPPPLLLPPPLFFFCFSPSSSPFSPTHSSSSSSSSQM